MTSRLRLKISPITHFISYDFLHALEASGSATARAGWQPQHLLAEGRRRRAPRRRALLSEIAFARRIRVRPRLGRGLRARRRRVLSQAPGLGAVHAGDRPPAPGAALARMPTGVRDGLIAGLIELCRRHEASVGALHLPAGGGVPGPGRPRLPAPHRPAIPLGERTATPPSTISWRRCRRASARPSSANGAMRLPPASRCTG